MNRRGHSFDKTKVRTWSIDSNTFLVLIRSDWMSFSLLTWIFTVSWRVNKVFWTFSSRLLSVSISQFNVPSASKPTSDAICATRSRNPASVFLCSSSVSVQFYKFRMSKRFNLSCALARSREFQIPCESLAHWIIRYFIANLIARTITVSIFVTGNQIYLFTRFDY